MTVLAAEGLPAGADGAGAVPEPTEEERRLLAYASAIGSEFDPALLADALGGGEAEVRARIGGLVARGFLRERPGSGRFGFADEAYRARVYRGMTESRLRILHAKIARSLEGRHPEPVPEEVVLDLGRHFFLGKVPEKAWRYNLRAARLAEARNDLEDAVHHLERARRDLLLLPDRPEEGLAEIDERRGDLHRRLGHPAVADAAYLASLERVRPEDRQGRARLLLARAEVAPAQQSGEMAAGLGEEALRLSTEIGDRVGQAAAHRSRSRAAYRAGDYESALDEAMRALELLAGADDPGAEGECAADIAQAFASLGPEVADEAIQWYGRAIARFDVAGDDLGRVRAYTDRAEVVGRTDPIQALEDLDRARGFADRLTSPQWVIRTLLAGTEYHLLLGEVEAAERDHLQATRLLERVVDPRSGQAARRSRAMIAERRGQWEEAEAAYRNAIARADELHLAAAAADAELRLAQMLFKTRNLEGARTALQAAERRGIDRLLPERLPALRALAAALEPAAGGSDGGVKAPDAPP